MLDADRHKVGEPRHLSQMNPRVLYARFSRTTLHPIHGLALNLVVEFHS
jgi:hypothetical protein